MPRRHRKSSKRQARRRQAPPVKRCAECGEVLTGPLTVCADCAELRSIRFWKHHYPAPNARRSAAR